MCQIFTTSKCSKCQDTIVSWDRHDFKYCSCNSIFVDGGDVYGRYGGDSHSTLFSNVLKYLYKRKDLFKSYSQLLAQAEVMYSKGEITMKPILVTVTEDDIKKADELRDALDDRFCLALMSPISLALTRQVATKTFYVGTRGIDTNLDALVFPTVRPKFKAPRSVRRFLRRLELDKGVSPFKFLLQGVE